MYRHGIECCIYWETGEIDRYDFTLRSNNREEGLELAKEAIIGGVLRGSDVDDISFNCIAANNTITFDKEVNGKLVYGEMELIVFTSTENGELS